MSHNYLVLVLVRICSLTKRSITKLLGESFKVHSHTLALGDDMGMTMSSSSSPTPEAEDEMESELE